MIPFFTETLQKKKKKKETKKKHFFQNFLDLKAKFSLQISA